MSDPSERRCDGCKFALVEDEGYSNYTVTGELFLCLKRLHPEREGFDPWYGEEAKLDFAKGCDGFEAGEHVHVDVDREEEPYDAEHPWWYYYIKDKERRGLAAALDRERADV